MDSSLEDTNADSDEMARLREEVGELRAQLAATRGRRAARSRRIVAASLVVVTSLVFTVAVAGVWARRNALNTDKWVSTVGPIAEDPAVQAALGNWITTEIMGLVDAQAYFERVLPERGQALAAPLADAVRGFVHDRVDAFLASDTFDELWVGLNRQAHARVVNVLEGGNAPNLRIEGDQVRLNLIPVINQVLARIGEASPEIFGRTVDIPTITVDDVPEAAIAKLEDSLGRDIPDDFGQFTVFDTQRLDQVQDAVDAFDRLVVAAVAVAVLLVALTLWVSPRRRRTLIQLMVGIALGVVVLRRVSMRLEDQVTDLAKPENRDAVRVVVGAFVSSLLDATAWILAIAAVVAVVAVVTGPYPWARALRRGTVSAVRRVGRAAGDERTAEWVADHRDALRIGIVVAAILVLLVADLSWFGLLFLAAVVGGLELMLVSVPSFQSRRA